MTRKEKFISLMHGFEQDRVLFYPILMHFAARYNGHTYGEFASDFHVLVNSNVRCLIDFNLDMVSLISDPYRETAAFGAPVEFVAEGVPKCKRLLIKSPEDIIALTNPDILSSPRTLDRIHGARDYKRILKEEVPLMGWVEGPLAEACDLAGVTEMLIMMMMDPDSANLLLDKCLKTAKDFARKQIGAGCDLIGVGDAICSQIDRELYKTYVYNRHQDLVDYIHSLGAYVKLHICGNTTHLWPLLSKLELDIIDLDYMVDMDDAYDAFGAEVTRCGNINPVDIQNMTAIQVFERSRALVERERGRKFILSGGCEITVNTPPENLKAMRDACGSAD